MGYILNTPYIIDRMISKVIDQIGINKLNGNHNLQVSLTHARFDEKDPNCLGSGNVFLDVKNYEKISCNNTFGVNGVLQYFCTSDSNKVILEQQYDFPKLKCKIQFDLDNIKISQINDDCAKKSLTFIDFYAILIIPNDILDFEDEIVDKVSVSYQNSDVAEIITGE